MRHPDVIFLCLPGTETDCLPISPLPQSWAHGFPLLQVSPASPVVGHCPRLFCWWMLTGSDLYSSQVFPHALSLLWLTHDTLGNLESHMLKMEELPSIWVLKWPSVPSALLYVQKKNFCCVGVIIFWVYLSPQFRSNWHTLRAFWSSQAYTPWHRWLLWSQPLCLYPVTKTTDVGKAPRERQTGGSTCTALPLVSAPMDAAVAIVLGTVAVLVSQMCK